MYPNEFLQNVWRKAPLNIKWTFLAAMLFGLFVHLFMFMNKLPNFDDVHQFYELDFTVTSGRWAIPFIEVFRGSLSIPWVIAPMAVFCIAVSACLVVQLVGLKSKLNCVITAMIMTSFPTIAVTFSYIYTALSYFFALMLACLSVHLLRCNKRYNLAALACLIVSISLYQAYLTVAVTLLVMCLLRDIIEDDDTFNLVKVVKKMGAYIAFLSISVLGYMLTLVFTAWQTGITDYQNIDSTGFGVFANSNVFISAATRSISALYCIFVADFFNIYYKPFMTATVIVFLSAVAVTIFILVELARKSNMYKSKTKLLVYVSLIFAFITACGFIYFYNANFVYMMMLYAPSMLIVFMLYLSEQYIQCVEYKRAFLKGKLKPLCSWVIAIMCVSQCYNYCLYANEMYLQLKINYERSYAKSVILYNSIVTSTEYREDIAIVLIGNSVEPVANREKFRLFVQDYYSELHGDFSRSPVYGRFLQTFLGVTNEITHIYWTLEPQWCDAYIGNYEALTADEWTVVDGMALYPAEGSIAVLGDRLVVNIARVPEMFLLEE